MPYSPAPTTYKDLMQFIPARGPIAASRLMINDKPFELRIGRNEMNIVWMDFSAPEGEWTFWPHVRTVESLTSQRDVWAHWQRFLEDPDNYLTWKYIAAKK